MVLKGGGRLENNEQSFLKVVCGKLFTQKKIDSELSLPLQVSSYFL